MKTALAQVCSLSSPFQKDVEDYAAGQCPAIEVWMTKLEDYVQARSIDELRRLLGEHGVTLPVGSFQGGLLASQGLARQQAWELFEQRLELCRELQIGTLVVACDVTDRLTAQDLERVRVSLSQAAELAGRFEIRLALEFQAGATLGNNLLTAAALAGEARSPHLGICLDAFHYFVGPSQPEDLGCLTAENLFHVQLCDLADRPRELAVDADRILPGDGDIPLGPIIDHLRRIEYGGFVSIELMNPSIWQVGPLQFGEIGMTALRKVLSLTEN